MKKQMKVDEIMDGSGWEMIEGGIEKIRILRMTKMDEKDPK